MIEEAISISVPVAQVVLVGEREATSRIIEVEGSQEHGPRFFSVETLKS